MKKIVEYMLVALTVASPMVSFALVAELSESHIFEVVGMLRYTWVALLFIPIGVVLLLYSRRQKRNGEPYRTNLVISVCVISWLLFFGLWNWMVYKPGRYDTAPVQKAGEITSVHMPNDIKVVSSYYDGGTVSRAKLLSEQEKEEFETDIATNGLWKTSLAQDISAWMPELVDESELLGIEYCLFYNVSKGEYNAAPGAGDRCIYISYDKDICKLLICDFYVMAE